MAYNLPLIINLMEISKVHFFYLILNRSMKLLWMVDLPILQVSKNVVSYEASNTEQNEGERGVEVLVAYEFPL